MKKLIAESQDTNGNFIILPPIPTQINNNPHDDQKAFEEDTEAATIPTVDFSILTSSATPEQRSKAINDLGFSVVINHGMPKNLMKAILDGCEGVFYLTDEEKQEFEGKHVLEPIRCGTSFNASVENVRFWRDFLNAFVYRVSLPL